MTQQMKMKKIQRENQTTCTSSTGTTEDSTDTASNRDMPQSMDIILGRGKGNTKNPGNILFQGKFNITSNCLNSTNLFTYQTP